MGFCSATPDILSNDSRCSDDKDDTPRGREIPDDKDNTPCGRERPNQNRLSSASITSEDSALGENATNTGTDRSAHERREWTGMDDGAGNEDGLVDEDWLDGEDWLEATFSLLDGVQTT